MKIPRKNNTRPLSHYPYPPPPSGENRQESCEPKMEVKEEPTDALNTPVRRQFQQYLDQNDPLPCISPEASLNYTDQAYYSSSPQVTPQSEKPTAYNYDDPLYYPSEHTESEPEDEADDDDDDDYEYKKEIEKAKRTSRKRAAPQAKQPALPRVRNYVMKTDEEKKSDDYRLKRERNNESVRKSRLEAKRRAEEKDMHLQRLADDNKMLRQLFVALQNDIKKFNQPDFIAQIPTLRHISQIQF